MKSLSDIQLEIRELEKQASGILNRLNALERDIGEIRDSGFKEKVKVNIDYGSIPELADKLKFGTHPISTYGRETPPFT